MHVLVMHKLNESQILNLALLNVTHELFGLCIFLEMYFQFSALLRPGSVFRAMLLCGESITVTSAPDKRNVPY